VARRRFIVEQIIGKLREGEVAIGKGLTVPQASRQIGVTEQTYYRWRKEYGGLRLGQAAQKRFSGRLLCPLTLLPTRDRSLKDYLLTEMKNRK
jgi:transposase-like protein